MSSSVMATNKDKRGNEIYPARILRANLAIFRLKSGRSRENRSRGIAKTNIEKMGN